MRLCFFYILTLIFSVTAQVEADEAVPYLLVTVAPHKFFVEKIAGNTVQVGLIVPAGASAHTYEPTPRQMLTAGKATLWFRVGEPFEARVIKALQSHNPNLQVVDMRQGLDLIYNDPHHRGCCHAGGADLHFWLSARLAKVQAATIADALIQRYPEHQALYRANLEKFQQELKQLDENIQQILSSLQNRHIMVSHPAYAYFCRDYNLEQISIEFEGKDPTPQQLTKVLDAARQFQIRTIFIQMQYNNKGARLIAEQIGAKVVTLDPYAEQYLKSMLEIAHAFSQG